MAEQQELKLVLTDLTPLEKWDLAEELGESQIQFESQHEDGDHHGEPATIMAIIVVSLAALKVLATYLAKKHNNKSFSTTVTVRKPNGEEYTREVSYTSSSSEPADAEILEKLTSALELNADTLAALGSIS